MARSIILLVAALPAGGCLSGGGGAVPSAQAGQVADSGRMLVPVGFGSLRQEDIAVRLQLLGLQVQAIPLDETIIRLLSPDSYRAMHELVRSQAATLESIERRTGLRGLNLWYVTFFGVQQGETPFSPMEFIITSVGRDFRPIEVIPLSAGFGRQRLQQRERQYGMYVFDPQVNVNQPLAVQFQTARSDEWASVLTRIERERALVLSRAGVRK